MSLWLCKRGMHTSARAPSSAPRLRTSPRRTEDWAESHGLSLGEPAQTGTVCCATHSAGGGRRNGRRFVDCQARPAGADAQLFTSPCGALPSMSSNGGGGAQQRMGLLSALPNARAVSASISTWLDLQWWRKCTSNRRRGPRMRWRPSSAHARPMQAGRRMGSPGMTARRSSLHPGGHGKMGKAVAPTAESPPI